MDANIPCLFSLGSAAVNNQTNEGVAIKKVTNVFSKKILAKRALREIKLLQHFRGHRNVSQVNPSTNPTASRFECADISTRSRRCISANTRTSFQITCLYDMDIPRPDNFNETYLYEGGSDSFPVVLCTF